MPRSRTYHVAKIARRSVDIAFHGSESAPEVGRYAKWQTSDNRAAREHVGVGGKQRGRHGPAGRQPGYVNPPAVESMILDHGLNHLPDRESFAAAALGIARLKPIEPALRVVRPPLLGYE